MTDEVKKQVKAEIDEAAKQQADTILQVYCQVYDKLPANLSEDEIRVLNLSFLSGSAVYNDIQKEKVNELHKSKIPREEKMKISKKRSKYPKKHPFFIFFYLQTFSSLLFS